MKPNTVTKPIALIRSALDNLLLHDPFQAAAALSFYSLLSLAPLVIVVAAIGGFFFSDAEIHAAIVSRLRDVVNDEVAGLAETVIENSTNNERNVVSLVIATVLMLIGSTTAFAHLHRILNRVWNVQVHGRLLLWHVVKGRLISFAFLITIGMLLAASLLFNTFLATFGDFLGRYIAIDTAIWNAFELATSYVATTLLLLLLYKFLPETHVRWRDAALGAVVATILFEGSKLLIRAYLAQARPGSAFGASGSVVVFLLWVYIASLIILIGAEVSRTAHSARSVEPSTMD